jgi:SAM-dependent methyltransferase
LLKPGDLCVDIGCSLGLSFDQVAEDSTIDFWGIDTSAPMIDRARARFRGWGNVSFECMGATEMVYPRRAKLTLCTLSLQFINPSLRLGILQLVRANSDHLILVEKTTGEHSDLIRDIYYGYKRMMGVSEHQIERKEVMLEGVLIPLGRMENELMLLGAGFSQVSQYWANGPFVGWVAS